MQTLDRTTLNQEIDRPKHYASKSGKDIIDWCEDFGLMSNAYVFNIFKYLARAGKKTSNSELQDALKAKVYLDRYIESIKNDSKEWQSLMASPKESYKNH